MADELDARIRSLEAERLRPVPPPPGSVPRTSTALVDELDARRARRKTPTPHDLDPGLRALRAAGEMYRRKNAQHGEADT